MFIEFPPVVKGRIDTHEGQGLAGQGCEVFVYEASDSSIFIVVVSGGASHLAQPDKIPFRFVKAHRCFLSQPDGLFHQHHPRVRVMLRHRTGKEDVVRMRSMRRLLHVWHRVLASLAECGQDLRAHPFGERLGLWFAAAEDESVDAGFGDEG